LFPEKYCKEFSHEVLRKARVNPVARCTVVSVDEIGDMCHAYYELCLKVPGLFFFDYRGEKSVRDTDWIEKGGYPPVYPFENEMITQL